MIVSRCCKENIFSCYVESEAFYVCSACNRACDTIAMNDTKRMSHYDTRYDTQVTPFACRA